MSKKQTVIETHGKEETKQPTMLEQVWGYNELSRYGTDNEQEYSKQLQDMHRTDLEAHARRIGIVVVESSARLRDKLVQEFRSYFASLHKPAAPPAPKPLSKNLREEAMKILAEGR